MALWSFINSDAIQKITHIVRLCLEQSLFLHEVDAVAHQDAQTGIKHLVSVLVVPTAKGLVDSCTNIKTNKPAFPQYL